MRLIGALQTSALCAVCGLHRGAPVCSACEQDYFPSDRARCAVCAIHLSTDAKTCGRCLRDPPAFDATLALADYVPPVDGMVSAMKSAGRLALAPIFGRLLAARVHGRLSADTLILPVPLAFERHAERGFNQALEIARALAQNARLQLRADTLLRVRHAAPQQSLALEARRRNVRGAFAVRSELAATLRGRDVAVVDDVMTTGSTLAELARVLKRAGVARVTNLVVARTP